LFVKEFFELQKLYTSGGSNLTAQRCFSCQIGLAALWTTWPSHGYFCLNNPCITSFLSNIYLLIASKFEFFTFLFDTQTVQKTTCLDSIVPLNYSIPPEAKIDSLFIFPQVDPITLEIGLFLDSKLFEHFQREFTRDAEEHLTEYALALINNVHVLYQQPSLSPNLDIVIVRFEMWKKQPVRNFF
jgi:hypothetical protein